MFMSLVCFILTFLSASIRLMITLDTIEKENTLAEEQEDEGVEVDSYSHPVSEEQQQANYHKKLLASKYENASFIWFARNSHGDMPVLFVPFMFIGLSLVMVLCLYYFYQFQSYQEELATSIEEIRMTRESDDKGVKLMVEQDQ